MPNPRLFFVLALPLVTLACVPTLKDADHFIITQKSNYKGDVNDSALTFTAVDVTHANDWTTLHARYTINNRTGNIAMGNYNNSHRLLPEFAHYWAKIALNILNIPPANSTFETNPPTKCASA